MSHLFSVIAQKFLLGSKNLVTCGWVGASLSEASIKLRISMNFLHSAPLLIPASGQTCLCEFLLDLTQGKY